MESPAPSTCAETTAPECQIDPVGGRRISQNQRGYDNDLRTRRRIGNAFEQFEAAASRAHEIDDNGSDKGIREFGFKGCGGRGLHDDEMRFGGVRSDVRGDLGIVVKYGDSGTGKHPSSPR